MVGVGRGGGVDIELNCYLLVNIPQGVLSLIFISFPVEKGANKTIVKDDIIYNRSSLISFLHLVSTILNFLYLSPLSSG